MRQTKSEKVLRSTVSLNSSWTKFILYFWSQILNIKTKNSKKTHIYLVNLFNLHPKSNWHNTSLYHLNKAEMALLRDDTRFKITAPSLNILAKSKFQSHLWQRTSQKFLDDERQIKQMKSHIDWMRSKRSVGYTNFSQLSNSWAYSGFNFNSPHLKKL